MKTERNDQNKKKPIVLNSYPKKLYMCPTCGSAFVMNRYGVIMNYCANCGQALESEV